MAEWQPIETAPNDGTPVYLCWPGAECAPLASWQCAEGGDEITGEGFYFMWCLKDDTLLIGEAEGWIGYEGDPVPTHWMPSIPEAS